MEFVAETSDSKLSLKKLLEFINNNSEIKNFILKVNRLTISNLNKFLKRKNYNITVTNLTGKQLKFHLENNLIDFPRCKECGKILKWRNNGSYGQFCSAKCSNKNSEKLKKIEETSLKKYGVKHPSQSEQSKKKLINTNLKKYGVRSTAQLDWVKEKAKQTCLKKFKHVSSEVGNIKNLELYNNKEFIKKNFLDENNYFKLKEFMNFFNCSQVAAHSTLKRLQIDFNHRTSYSNLEKEIINFIKEIYSGEIIENSRKIISPYELDIYIPEKNLAIEFNGLYWHSFNDIDSLNEFKFRHLNKTKLCEEKDINLLHIFENEWLDLTKQDIWKSIISYKLGIVKQRYFARKLEIKEINSKLARDFFEENHIQGYTNAGIRIGLFDNQKLISCMTFAKPRFNKNYQYELIRFASLKYTSCVGCAQKLFKYFLRKYQPESIISYANRRWAFAKKNIYQKLNFKFIKETEPNYYYFKLKDLKLYHRSYFQKYKLKNYSDIQFDPSLTETEIMFNSGYRRIYDCGNLVYEFRRQK